MTEVAHDNSPLLARYERLRRTGLRLVYTLLVIGVVGLIPLPWPKEFPLAQHHLTGCLTLAAGIPLVVILRRIQYLRHQLSR